MKKQLKKQLALIMALIMALQWVPARADEPTVTVDGTSVTVDMGNSGTISAATWSQEVHNDGDIKIEDGLVYEWDASIRNWVLVVDDNGDSVDPALYADAVSPVEVDTNASLYVDNNRVDLPETIDSLTVNAGDVSAEGSGYVQAVYVSATSDVDPVDTNVHVENIVAVSENHHEATAATRTEAYGVSANAGGISGDAEIQVTVSGTIETTAVSDNGYAYSDGIYAGAPGGSVSIEAGDINAVAAGTSVNDRAAGEAVGVNVQIQDNGVEGAERQVTAGDVTATVEANNVEEEYGYSQVYSNGVFARDNAPDTSVSIEVGNVESTAIDENLGGHATATGINEQVRGGSVSVTAEDVTTTASGTNTEAVGIRANVNAIEEYNDEKESWETVAAGEMSANTGDVTVISENGSASGMLINDNGKGSTAEIVAGNVDVTASADFGVSVKGISENGNGQEINVKTDDVTVDLTSTGETRYEQVGWDEEAEKPIFGERNFPSEAVGVSIMMDRNNTQEGSIREADTGNITVHAEAGQVEDGEYSGVNAKGIVTNASSPNTSIIVNAENVNVSAENGNQYGEANATGISSLTRGSTSDVKAGNVTVTSDGATGNANGVIMEANFNSIIDENGNRVRMQGETNVETGNITATSETGSAVGADSHAKGGVVNAETGSVTAVGNGAVTGVNIGVSDLIGWDIDDNQFKVDGEATTNVDGNITAAVGQGMATAVMANVVNGAEGTVTVTGNAASSTEDGNAYGVRVITEQGGGAEATVTVEGNVAATAKNSFSHGINASAQVSTTANVTVEGDVTSEADVNAIGVTTYANGGSVNVETGSVTANGDTNATGIQTNASTFSMRDEEGNVVSSKACDIDITANGNVTATSAEGEATGIKVVAYSDSETDVVVVGDVTAEGKEKGVGISVQNDNADVDIVVDGTVSGSTNAIVVLTSQAVNGNVQASMNVADTALTVWAAEKNEDGHVAVAVDRNIEPGNKERPAPIITDTINEEATKALEAAINYIVKTAKDFTQQVTASGEKQNSVTVGDTTYATANEGENVNVSVTLEDNQMVEGVYYNADDENSLQKAEDLTKAEDGSFLMKMLRGGAMLLGLKIHTHSYVYVYNNDATCTQDGTETATCSCGQTNGTRTKAGTMLGHSFTNYVSDGNATCTSDGTKTAKCDRCAETDTIADPGSKLSHSFTNYVSNKDATCTADGTKTAKCDRCAETDTIVDVDSHLNVAHTPGESTLVTIEGSLYQVVYCAVCGSELSRDPYTTTDTDPDPEPDNNNNNAPDDANITPEGGNETPNVEDNTSTVPEPEKTVATETSIAADGSSVNREMETSTATKENEDGSVTVTDTLKETVISEGMDGSRVEIKTENTEDETKSSQKNEDGSVTDTTIVKSTETVTETATDADGNTTAKETKTEVESNTAVTTTENEDGSVTETTEKTETVKVTEKVTDAEGNITEALTETVTATVINMTMNEDGTETGISTTTATVKDEKGNVLSESVTETEIKASTDENGTKTTETKATITTKDAAGNVTVETTVTTENKAPDGSTGTIVKDEEGNILSQDTTISQEAFDKATEENRPILGPLTVEPVDLGSCDALPPIKVNLPLSLYDKDGDGKVNPGERPKLEIPVSRGGAGVIVAEVSPDGDLIISKECYESSVIVPLIGSSSIVVFDNAKTFADVSESDWYYEYVTFVTAREIINGVDEDNYAPDEAMSRAMLAQMLYGFDRSAKAGNGAQFDDVSEDDLFSGAVGWACENGIMESNEGSFKPMDEVACQDMITALYRWAETAGYDVSARARIDNFSDADSAADYAKDALRWAAGWGLIGGEDDGALTLTGSVTRAQAASIMTHFVRNAR